MRVSLRWLREFVEIDLSVDELVERLNMTGTAVESVESADVSLEGVVVGRVLTRDRHPDAGKLSVSMVEVGADEPLQIVCGADNYQAGDKVPVALVGAELSDGTTIGKSKIRGVASHGMMCSPIELGVGTDASGLLILPEDAPVGMGFVRYKGMDDVVLDLEITPNRPDCLSVTGMAREIGAILDREASWPMQEPEESGVPAADVVRVEIEDGGLCPRYTARVIRGVSIGQSPGWLVEKIVAAGARPINNIVDVTNLVMFETGQPLHAFDLATMGTQDGKTHIIVRRAREGERLVTIDEQECKLTGDMIVIAGPDGPVALAGVMGGGETEVGEDTVDILLESASFDPSHISRTSRNLGLVSEASSRFEKRVDPAGCAAAADRAAALMAEVAAGRVAPGVVDAYPLPAQTREIGLRVRRLNEFLGTALDRDAISSILARLGLEPAADGVDLMVAVPTWRPDLEREEDLFEEVVRIYGMERVESTLPGGRERVGGLNAEQRWHARIGDAARGAGLNETVTYAFADVGDAERLGWRFPDGETPVELINPISEEQGVLRWTLAPGLIHSASYNQRHGVTDIHLYEMGMVFLAQDGSKQPNETLMVGGLLAGSWDHLTWNDPAEPLGFFDGKGVIESIMEELHVSSWQVRAADRPWLQPGRSAEVVLADRVVGWLGEVHPKVLEAYEAEAPVTLFELAVPALVRAARPVVEYVEVPRFPSVNLDLALVVAADVTAEQVMSVMREAGKKMLESVRLFDVYVGEGIPGGKKSLAFSLAYRVPDRTLTDDEVRKVHERVIAKVRSALHAEVRG